MPGSTRHVGVKEETTVAKLSDEQRKALQESIPREAVTQRKQSGQTLDYVEGWWVIAELNRILGPDGWSFEVLREAWPLPLGERKNSRDEPRLTACFQVTGRLTFADGSTREDVGIGSGVSKSDPVSVIEGATKEAVTDCIKRCARQMGNRTGGALYQKPDDSGQRTHVDDRPQWAKDAMQAIADLRTEAEAGKGSLIVAQGAVAEVRASLLKLPNQHKRTVLEDLMAVAALVTDGDAESVAKSWIIGQKTEGKAA